MKEKVVLGLKILAIFVIILCIAAVVWYFWQKKALENKSMDFLKQYNMLAYPQDIYDKNKTEVSEEELRQWDEKVSQQMGKFMKRKSKLYQRMYEEMKERFLDEVKMKPEKRVKSSEQRIMEKYSSHLTLDTAKIDFLVEEAFTRYDGKKEKEETEFIFMYVKEGNQWILSDLHINFPTL